LYIEGVSTWQESYQDGRYAEIIAFFKATVKNPKAPLRIRYASALRLDDIYRRADELAERAGTRKATQASKPAESAPSKAEVEVAAEVPESPEQVEERKMKAVFTELLGGR